MKTEAQKHIKLSNLKLNDRQLLLLTKIANFGIMTQKMLALYLAVYYPEIKDKLQAVRNTTEQLIKKDLIKKVVLGFGEYRLIYILKNKGKIVTENENIYFIKSSQKIYQSGFRHQIITNHITIFIELLKKEKIVKLVHENQIRKFKANKKWISKSVPDFLLATNQQKAILIEYEKNLKNDPRKLVEKLINYQNENLKSIKNGIEVIYFFVANERKKKRLEEYFLKADLVAKEYAKNYQTYLENRKKIKIKSVENLQNFFIKKFDCFELESEEIFL